MTGVNESLGAMPQRDSEVSPADPQGDPRRIAYLQDMLSELGGMARGGGHDFLGYLIDMAQKEAGRLARGGDRSEPHWLP